MHTFHLDQKDFPFHKLVHTLGGILEDLTHFQANSLHFTDSQRFNTYFTDQTLGPQGISQTHFGENS